MLVLIKARMKIPRQVLDGDFVSVLLDDNPTHTIKIGKKTQDR